MGALFDSVVIVCMSVLAYLIPEYRAVPMSIVFAIVGARLRDRAAGGKGGGDSAALMLLVALGSLFMYKNNHA